MGSGAFLVQAVRYLGDRLVERDLALLDQHHERDRGDRLAHRIDAEDGVVLDRRVAPGKMGIL